MLLVAVFLLAVIPGANAEEPAPIQPTLVFDNTYGGPDAERGIFVTEVKGGGFIAVGSTRRSGEGEEDVYLVRTDAQGQELWSATFGGAHAWVGWCAASAVGRPARSRRRCKDPGFASSAGVNVEQGDRRRRHSGNAGCLTQR